MVAAEERHTETIHFFSPQVPSILQDAVQALPDRFALVDLGCGDGHIVFVLKASGLLQRASQVIGVDTSPRRVENFEASTGFKGLLSSCEQVSAIADGTLDFVISTMVIEHVPDDAALLAEIRRLLKTGGHAYLTTVFKQNGAWYFRRSPDGRWVLDPTHVREYASKEIFLNMVVSAGFSLEKVHVSRLSPPIAHPVLRAFHRYFPVSSINSLFIDRSLFKWIEKVKIPIPGYRSIETLIRKS